MISKITVIVRADPPRFGPLGVTAIFQPLWACDEPYMRLTMEKIGPERSHHIYPEQGVLKGGGRIAYGSDWPVATADPLQGIEVALTRAEPGVAGAKALLPEQAVTLAEAIKAYTLEVAWVNHMEHETGSIEAGKSADLIVLDNCTLAPRRVHGVPKGEAEQRARDLLEQFGLADQADKHPDRMSGGQQQRAALVRALCTQPTLLLLDEITAALDPELVGDVLRIVRELAEQGTTMILATHEMAFAREVASAVCFLDQGRVCEQGTPEQIFSEPAQERTRRFLARVLA
jgi:ABC-type dipeptide/oligopeptide/nickel transport system ATPase subunit